MRTRRASIAATIATLLCGVALGAPTSPAPSPPRGAPWTWPLRPRPSVSATYLPPASDYGSGHRGIDLAGTFGQPVFAVADGIVTHAAFLAGRGTVTVRHTDGLWSTYEPVAPKVGVGDVVARGDPLGTIGVGGHCQVAGCLHLGALRGPRDYLDPLALLGERIILLPLAPSGGRGRG